MKITYLNLGIWLSAICLVVCAALLVAELLMEHKVSIEDQCRHMNKFHFNGEYGPCPNQKQLRVYP